MEDGDFTIAKRTLDRLQARSRLKGIATEILRGLAEASAPADNPLGADLDKAFVGEMNPWYFCNPPIHGGSFHFNCTDNDFSCSVPCPSGFGTGQQYVCGQGSYSSCGSNEHSCEQTFNCGADIYNCQDFSCDNGYTCNQKYDFICGLEYDCVDATDFDCTSGHIFACDTNNECWDTFTCESPGDPPCTDDYDWGGDHTSGDFTCGDDTYGSDNFDCTDTFHCSSKDDFDCLSTTDFDCGNALPGTDTFDCGGTNNTNFDCESTFDCHDSFDCSGDYDCATYTCSDTFSCDADFSCDTFTCTGSYSGPPCP